MTSDIKKSEKDALSHIASIPRDEHGPVFNAPWEAQAFAMTLALYEKGVFTWTEWANTLSGSIRKGTDDRTDNGSDYYHHWLNALEQIVVEKGVTNEAQLSQLYDNWNHAAMTTPHGEPIELKAKSKL